MELSGNLPSQSEKQPLWNALTNIEVWKDSIPEAEKCEQVSDDTYELSVKAELGPIKGTQVVKIHFTDLNSPDSCGFELQHSLVKSAKGTFTLENADWTNPDGETTPVGEDTKTILVYNLNADAGNPLFNAVLESMKGKIKEGFDELLGRVAAKAQ